MTRPHVILGVSASVAIHRTLDVASELRKREHPMTIVMTPGATKLITPLQFGALSGARVLHDVFAGEGEDVYDHLGPARSGDVLLVVPASADVIGRLAHGLANDLLTTTAIAWDQAKPRLFAPAMNWRMWAHPFVQRNAQMLIDSGWTLIPPEPGDLACGENGPGRLAPVDRILSALP